LLGQHPPRIPTGGKIRAGIKVLTRKAEDNARARDIYECGVADGRSFEQIEKAICEAVPELKTPLVPKNVPWFTVRGDDFANPATARQILDAFGEDRGDGVKRLYRFPVVFPSDQWQTVMPHELVAWGASERRFWSEYSDDGRTRWCKCHAPVPMDESGKRAIRLFGGRKTVTRADNGGLCEPALPRIPAAPVQPVRALRLLHPRHRVARRVRAGDAELLRDERGHPALRGDRVHARRTHLGLPRRPTRHLPHDQEAGRRAAHR
jgi:hypothetical protein